MEKYIIKPNVTAVADEKILNSTFLKLWKSFFLREGELSVEKGEPDTFKIGDVSIPELQNGSEYSLCIEENGVAVRGRDYGGLMRGLFSLLMKLEHKNKTVCAEYLEEQSGFVLKNRMIHICVFPENNLYFIKKLIRLSALCGYTHIIIEFWGMLKYDCLRELAWPEAFSKEDATELIKEARELGIEPIPMFNMLGHASASRVIYGKHVVLDQNPKLQELFTPDGWAWDITSDQVYELLSKIRRELYELFGEGEYIHIGCDEAYFYTNNDEMRAKLPEFMSRLTKDIEKEGRRPMIWMDMFLEAGKFKGCYTVGKPDEVERIMQSLAPSTVLVDWQYDVKSAPIESLEYLQDSGFDSMGAPWFNQANYTAHIETVKQNGLHGVMLTTWHTLKEQMPSIVGCATKLGASFFTWSTAGGIREQTATLMRRVSFEGNSYTESGWSERQISV